MAKFNIEVELDWVEEEGFSIDDAIKQQVISGVKHELLKKATDESVKALDKEIAEKVSAAGEIIQKKVDSFISNVTEKQIGKMQIPIKKGSSWSTEYEFISMSEFVGKRYEEHLNKKVFDYEGNTARYDSDKKLSISEFFINKYLEKELTKKVEKLIQNARKEAEETIIKTLEITLKNQLSADIINRLNIPEMLSNLQEKALYLEQSNQNTDGGKN